MRNAEWRIRKRSEVRIPQPQSPGRDRLPLAAILAAALALRLWNLGFGLPDWYHPDEPNKVRAIVRIAGGDLDPGTFYHPSFMLYASAAVLRGWHVAGGSIDESGAIRAGRLTVALLGSATVALTWLLGRSMGGAGVGLLAAALLAVSPLHVVCSHYLKEDVPLAFWMAAAFLASLRVARRGTPRDYALAGFLAGVAAGTKYTGLLAVALPWLAHRERDAVDVPGAGHLRRAWIASAAGFLAVTPYALLGFPRFVAGIGHEGGYVFTGMSAGSILPLPYLWTFHLHHSLVPGFGALPLGLALVGFVASLRARSPRAHLLSAAVFGFWAVAESSPYKPPPNYDRYVVPLLPFLAVLAAQAAAALAKMTRRSSAALALLAAVSAIPSAASTAGLLRDMRPDTREIARDWLVRHACGRGRILLEGGLYDGGRALPAYVPQLPPGCDAAYDYSLFRLRDRLEQYDVIVATSFMYDRFLRFGEPSDPARRFYEDFFAGRTPAAEFAPPCRSYGFHNPTIRIYARTGALP